jgi:hypothetical protein
MAFDQGLMFAVAHTTSSRPRLIAGPAEPARVLSVSEPTPTGSWGVSTMAISGGSVPLSLLKKVFPVLGNDASGTVGFSTVELFKLASTLVDAIVNSFIGPNGLLTVKLNGGQIILVQLRACKTGDFLVSGNSAQAAHYTGVTAAPNFPAGTAEAYTSADFVSGPPGGPFSEVAGLCPGIPASDSVTLPVSGKVPPDEVTHGLYLRLTANLNRLSDNNPSPAPYPKSSVIPVDLHVPTQLAVLMDRSSRMLNPVVTDSSITKKKWLLAREVAHMLNTLLGQLIPDRTTSAGTTIKSQNQIGFFPFNKIGLLAGTAFQVPGNNVAAWGPEPLEDANHLPTLGKVLSLMPAQFLGGAGGAFRRRHILLLTDGFESSTAPSPRLDDLGEGSFPSLTPNPATGIILTNVDFAAPTDSIAPALTTCVTGHNGSYDASSPDGSSAATYRASVLGKLGTMLPIGVSTLPVPTATTVSVTLEVGADKAVILATKPNTGTGALAIALSDWPGRTAGAPNPTTASSNETAFGYTCLTISPVQPGSYTLINVPLGSRLIGLYDLAIRSTFTATGAGLGKPIHLRAELTYSGAPLRHAEARVRVTVPSSSQGELLSSFLKEEQGLARSLRRRALDEVSFTRALLEDTGSGNVTASKETPKQGYREAASGSSEGADVLIRSAREQLNYAEEYVGHATTKSTELVVLLQERKPGVYEATVPALHTQNEGFLGFDLKVDGVVGGVPFARNHRASLYLESIPDPNESESQVVEGPDGKPHISFTPRNSLGKRLGPGLAPLFQFRFDRGAAELPSLRTRDGRDGSYGAVFPPEIPPSILLDLPPISVVYRPGSPVEQVIPVGRTARQPTHQRVRVCLEKVQILDDKDPCFLGDGEFQFFARVSPASGGIASAWRKVAGPRGSFDAGAGAVIQLDTVVFDDLVGVEDKLQITLGGREIDWPSWLDGSDSLTTYRRNVPVPAVSRSYGPGDEGNDDPESLSDWKVWYRLEVV